MKTRQISKENERIIIDMYVDGVQIYEICRTVNVYQRQHRRDYWCIIIVKPSECKYGDCTNMNLTS